MSVCVYECMSVCVLLTVCHCRKSWYSKDRSRQWRYCICRGGRRGEGGGGREGEKYNVNTILISLYDILIVCPAKRKSMITCFTIQPSSLATFQH